MDTLDTTLDTNYSQKFPACKYLCECGKVYKYSQGLSKHKSKCTFQPGSNKIDESINTLSSNNIVMELLHLFSFKTPILLDKKIRKSVKSIVGISPTMV